jgi:uncharacterized protein (TIGR02145 family)
MGILSVQKTVGWIVLVSLLWLASCNATPSESTKDLNPDRPVPGEIISDVDGNRYPTIRIGTQVWMAANLKTTRYRDGSIIPNVSDATQWGNVSTGAWVHYGNETRNDSLYGKLYNGQAVIDTRGLCPSLWRIPTRDDWDRLTGFLGGSALAGKKMKSRTGWTPNGGDGNGTNDSGFDGKPSGLRWFNGSGHIFFINAGSSAVWWSSDSSTSSHLVLRSGNDEARREWYSSLSGAAVRCVRE